MNADDLKGKRLLYLGGIPRARYVVQRARELGIYVIVADYNENSPAKCVANEGVLVDALDVDALIAIGCEKHIDGIMTGYSDILLPICSAVANKLGLPCYMTDDMIRFTTDKGYFKNSCNEYGVPVPKQYEVDENDLMSSALKLTYPVFIKPMDASGSRGASACYNRLEFEKKFFFAKAASKSGRVSVEECLTGVAFILDYALVDGRAYLLSMADCYASDGRPAAVNSPNLMILPSKNIRRYLAKIDCVVRDFFAGKNYNNGIFFFQGYATDDMITFYEAGCRLGGTWPYVDQFFYKINPLDMLFRYALTGSMLAEENPDVMTGLYDGYAAIIYFISNKPSGKISAIKGVDVVGNLSYVVNLMQYYFVDDTFDLVKSRITDVRFMAVHLVAKNYNELVKRINFVYSQIDFVGSDGTSLLAPVYDIKNLSGYEMEG